MKVLMTGASSFTGLFFVKELLRRGMTPHLLLPRKFEEYEGVRKVRVEMLKKLLPIQFEAPFGGDIFLSLLDEIKPDVLAHHASQVKEYRSDQFDVIQALQNNSYRLEEVLKRLSEKELILTGSVFEPREGGSEAAVSPYGLSKGLTYDFFSYYASRHKVRLKKFVIANPFGPYEEDRFTFRLFKEWKEGKEPKVLSKEYVRDNIPNTLLAHAYSDFVMKNIDVDTFTPSFYKEKNEHFFSRFQKEIQKRVEFPCTLHFPSQEVFKEPMSKVGSYPYQNPRWEENKFWDQLVNYYQEYS